MEELYVFLFAGLAMIFLLFAFFGGPRVDLNYGTDTGDKDFTANNITWKEIYLGDVISSEKVVEETKYIEKNISVQSGFFFGSAEYAKQLGIEPYILNNLDNATLTFDISNTNNYGSLNMSIDNRTLLSENPLRGKYSVTVPKLSKNSVIYIKTTSSGWRVWAPSMYEVSNLNLNVAYNTKEVPNYDFDVPHYVYNSFYKGEIKFNSIYPADLKVSLNGQEIYHNLKTIGSTTITLKKSYLMPETNTIEFDSINDFRFENMKIYLYYRD